PAREPRRSLDLPLQGARQAQAGRRSGPQRGHRRAQHRPVAPVTSTIRNLPSQVVIGTNEGLDYDSAVSLDHVQCVDRAKLIRRLGRLPPARMREVCAALAVATGCE
ncbi:MAG: type II toxin-antitoxin system PemK/MazF family toxin, partial [Deltaproteobacteria bacterium]